MTTSHDAHFGLCPICHRYDGHANAGRSHRFYCKEHKTSWQVGENLFSNWREQTEEEQRKIWNEIGLNEFADVEPYFPRTFEDVHADLLRYMRTQWFGVSRADDALRDRATRMLQGWDWATDNSVDERGNETLRDYMDPNVVKLLDEYLEIKYRVQVVK